MNDGFACFVLWISVILGYLGIVYYYRFTVLSWAESQWWLAGGRIHFGPAGATCYGTHPTGSYRRREGHYGAVGVVGENFAFFTRHHERFIVPLASITWIGERRIRVRDGKYSKKVTALMVHGEYQDRYFVLTLSSDQRYAIEQQLSARCHLRPEYLGERSKSLGPVTGPYVTQDIYGDTLDQSAAESLERARQRWQRAGRTIRFGPVKAFYRGDQPDRLNRSMPEAGALAIVDDRLIFRSASSANFEIDLPLESIRWFGQANVIVQQVNALTFYVERNSRWRLYTIGVEDVEAVTRALQEIGGVALNPDPDYGPVRTLRYDQNIYGHWVPDHTVRLYLIPDHLLADWRTAVRFDQIRGLAVLPSAGLSSPHSALLTVRYTSDDGRPRGVGFALGWSKAFAWATILQERTGVKLDQVERKKKVG